jgi:hypothetical protein
MTKSKGRRPSPAMIVALAALVVALAGTAMAAPTAIKSILNKKEKKQVKNISKNQVNALAPGLSVKHAGTAGSADTAKRADTAANADAIGGVALKDISVAKSDDPGAQCDPNSSTLIVCASVDLTLPHEGRVLLLGTAGQVAFGGAQAAGSCLFRVNGVNSGGSVQSGNNFAPVNTGVNARAFPDGFATTVVTDPISAGAHTFALACNETDTDVEFQSPQITAALVGSGG